MDNDFDCGFDEYNDPDATACANGDYNVWEENEVFHEMQAEMYGEDDDFDNDPGGEDRGMCFLED